MWNLLEFDAQKYARRLPYLVSAIALCATFFQVMSSALVGSVWDDAYMTVRYAHNILLHGTISWNGTIPTYGFTSAFQLLLTLPFTAMTNDPAAAAIAASLAGTLLFLLSIPFLVGSLVPEADRSTRLLIIAASYSFIAFASYPFGILAGSGMDTMLMLAYLCLYIGLIVRASRSLASISTKATLGIGVLGGLAYLMRPDLMVITILIPLALALWSPNKIERQRAWIILMVSGVTLAAILAAAWLYFGTPVPLPFYQKSGLLDDPTTRKRFLFQPILQLVGFVDDYKYLFIAPIAFLIAGMTKRRLVFKRGAHAVVVIGLMAGLLASGGYFFFLVVQIMGAEGRFYYPMLPILLALTGIAIAYILKHLHDRYGEHVHALTIVGTCIVLLVGLYTPFLWGAQQFGYVIAREGSFVKFMWTSSALAIFKHDSSNEEVWPCLDTFASLPDDASVATTEVGMPAVIAPGKYILDLAGLNSTEIALRELTPASAILAHHIDLVYLPWRQSYPEMRAAILDDPDFQSGYQVFSGIDVGSEDDVAVRSASPYAPALESCLKALIAAQKASGQGPTPGELAAQSFQFNYYLTFPYPLVVEQ